MKCDEPNVFGLHEYKRQDIFLDMTDEVRDADRFYIMIEADEVIAGLRNENEDLKNELYAVKTDLAMSQRWRKCSEELPEEGVEVLVTNGIDCGISDWCGDYWNNDPFCGYTVCDNVIAWMPLPKAPEADK